IGRSHSAGSDTVLRTLFYDSLGRLVFNIEPNTSYAPPGSILPNAWTYAYNDNGELVATSDARGCGKNIAHDALGRVTSIVYSPSPGTQPAYRPPNFVTGDNVAVQFTYDTPAHPNGFNDETYVGKLTQTYDEAQHSSVDLDARGRPTKITRQLAAPNAGRQPFATRYAPHEFHKEILLYDGADRVLDETTGASAPAPGLAPPDGSWIRANYTLPGTIDNVQSTYGTILVSQQIDPTGRVTHRVFGDVANTAADYSYEPATGLLSEAWVHRGPGPWSTDSVYTPPAPGDPNTL